jgi:type I restriction enzyme S subunit
MFKAESYTGYKLCWPGDLVINSLWAWSRGLGVSPYHGIISSAYGVYRLRKEQENCAAFIHELVRSTPFKWELYVRSKGIWISRLQLTDQAFLDAPFPLPPFPEQVDIVRFLHHADRRIRKYIHAKQKLIKLLEEQKQAIIHRAVTRGLDPNARLKPSGIEWLGEIPEQWKITKLARLTTQIGDGLHGTPKYVEESPYHFINGNNLTTGVIKVTPSTRCVSADELEKHKTPLNDSTMLMAINGTIGSVAYYRGEKIILGKSAAYINCRKELSRNYLFYFLQSAGVAVFFRREITGTTIFNLSLESIRKLSVALPPLAEQLTISSFLDQETAVFSDLIAKANLEIVLLREFNVRLTADVVTGKLDVREAASQLPEEEPEAEPLDEVDDLPQDESAAEDVELEAADAL